MYLYSESCLVFGFILWLLLEFRLFHSQAEEIAEKLCESVEASLEGKKLASFTRISSTVQVLCALSLWL